MSFGQAITSVFSKYANFSGRARRSEYWYYLLFYFLVSLLLGVITYYASSLALIYSLWILVMFIPSISVTVRRLHDIGKSGWYFFAYLIAYCLLQFLTYIINFDNLVACIFYCIFLVAFLVYSIILIVWCCRNSQLGENKWGPDPKERSIVKEEIVDPEQDV